MSRFLFNIDLRLLYLNYETISRRKKSSKIKIQKVKIETGKVEKLLT